MSLLDVIGWKATGARNRLVDRIWERRLDVRTRGNVMIYEPDAKCYGTFAYSSILKILSGLDWRPDDTFVDIGCGKGRVVCCAALFPIRKVIGLDLDEGLCRQARDNARRMRHRQSPIEIAHVNALEFDYGECTKFFLFNPFGAATLASVLQAIERSLESNPREIQMVYLNPECEQVLEEAANFERYDRWRARPWGGLRFDVSFWTWRRPSG